MHGPEVDEKLQTNQLCLYQHTDDLAFLSSSSRLLLQSFEFVIILGRSRERMP